MLMKNFFVIFTLLLLALADLGSSVPQRRGLALSPLGLQDVATLAASTSAVPFPGASKACVGAINKAMGTGIMNCLPMNAIIQLMAQPKLLAEIAKDPLHTLPKLQPYFDLACSVKKCSDDLIQNAANLVFTGCAADLVAKVPIVQLVFAGLVLYTPAIDIICFKDQASTYCLIETDNILVSLPPPQVTIPGLEKMPLIGSVALASPINICTPCNKAIINTFFDYYKDSSKHPLFLTVTQAINYTDKVNTFVNLAVDVKCGISPFNDGNVGDPSKGPDPPVPGH